MKVRLPIMIQDPMTARYKGMSALIEHFDTEGEDFFLDGPVTRRVAVLDLDADTGDLLPGARFRPPKPGRVLGGYEVADEGQIYAADFLQVSVFATVLKTMEMFEEEDALGRDLVWAFNAPQLLVIPRAGEWDNAYYARDCHGLQFFYFPNPRNINETIYTSLSRDIVAHETGHAVLDGIAPELYNAVTPQSLALHEAIADLTALLMAFDSNSLRETVLGQTDGSIRDSTAFSSIAEEFGLARNPEGGSLRSMLNEKTLDPDDTGLDRDGRPKRVPRHEPHALSEVLSGALYSMMVGIHEQLKQEYAGGDPEAEFSVSGKALAVGADRFKRMIFRALDYLPPGEVSFADYGRAIIAADQASHPDDQQERETLRGEFVTRHMVTDREALEVETNYDHPALKDVDLETLVESDWAAYEFVNRTRDDYPELLRVPPEVPFRVWPRLDVTKLYYHRDGKKKIRECLLKVSWDQTEPNPLGHLFPSGRQITVGTTLAIDWDERVVRAVLTSDHTGRPGEQQSQQEDRDDMLRWLADEGLMQFGGLAIGPDGRELRSVVRAESADDLMRVREAARMLHIVREG